MALDWDKLRTFYSVVEAGSFTNAGERLMLSQSAVSRQILGLEESLKVPLFHRHARGLIMTEQGEILYVAVKEIFARLALTESLLTENREKPQGILRVTTTVAFGALWLAPRLKRFLVEYPDVQIDLILDDRELDLGRRDADVGIRIVPSRNPDLIQRKLMSYALNIYASQAYIEANGTPETTADIKSHDLIAFSQTTGILPIEKINWILSLGLPRGQAYQPILSINNIHGILQAIQEGIGIGVLPEYLVAIQNDMVKDPAQRLVRLLPDVPTPQVEAYYVYPEELKNSKRISVFRDYLISIMKESGFSTL